MKKNELNGYSLSRRWFDFAFENPDMVTPTHTALYFWFAELNNRMGWADKFAAPASYGMSALGIKHHSTYKKAFDDLVTWGFVKIIEKSRNQYTANIISLKSAMSNFSEAHSEALSKALAIYINKKPRTLKHSVEKLDPVPEIISYLNEKTGKNFRHTTEKTRTLITARLKEGFTTEDFKQSDQHQNIAMVNRPGDE